jgi:predicted transcriptional regulator
VTSDDNIVQLESVTAIVAAYVANNTIQKENLGALILDVFQSLAQIGQKPVAVEQLKPAVPVKRSIQPDHIVCLEDGKKFKSLKRHLMSHYNMTPPEWVSASASSRWKLRLNRRRQPDRERKRRRQRKVLLESQQPRDRYRPAPGL